MAGLGRQPDLHRIAMFKMMECGGSLLMYLLFSCEVASRTYRGYCLLAQRVRKSRSNNKAPANMLGYLNA